MGIYNDSGLIPGGGSGSGLTEQQIKDALANNLHDGEVATFADLPEDRSAGDVFYVTTSTGIPFTAGRSKKGVYIFDGTAWSFLNEKTSVDISVDDSALSNLTGATVQDLFSSTSAALLGKSPLLHTHLKADIIDLRTLDSTVIVKQASDLAVIDSTKFYFIDGVIDMGSQAIEVPAGGFYFGGSDYFVCGLISSADNYTMFVNKTGEAAGNWRSQNVTLNLTGVNSQLFNLDNQKTNGAVELISTNVGAFGPNTTVVGELTDYRQFRTEDVAFIGVADGLTFNGEWSGGFAIRDTVLLILPDNISLFKEGTNLNFLGSSVSDINALSVGDSVTVFDFQESNFSKDWGFILDGARFRLGETPVPNIPRESTKRYFKASRGVRNTFPGGRWECTAQVVTPLVLNQDSKLLGTTAYSGMVHFTGVNNNEFVYNSLVESDYNIVGQIIVDGGANDTIRLQVRKYIDGGATFETLDTYTRSVVNSIGGNDNAIFNLNTPTILNQNDTIELWIANITDNTNVTMLIGSYIRIAER